MRYLVLSADYIQVSLRDEDPDSAQELWDALSAQLGAEISEWNAAYQSVVQMGPLERAVHADAIAALDRVGLDLAHRISEELRPAKVRYYSEGRLRYLP